MAVAWNPEIMADVIGGLTKASNDIDVQLTGVDADVNKNLDYENWHDDARPIYDEQHGIWTKAAGAMHECLHAGGIPALTNMSNNLDMTEAQNKATWSNVYD